MTTKRSGVVNWPILILIAIVAGLAAVGLFLGIPYLQGRPEFARGTFPVWVEGNQIIVKMDPDQEVALRLLPGESELGTGGQINPVLATGTPAIVATQLPPATVAPTAVIPTIPPPTATTQPLASCILFTNHTVQAGQTLFSISRQYVTSIALMARHGISSTSLTPGAVLRVPVGDPSCCRNGWRPYVVESGESWFGIAQQCGITLDALLQGNGATASTTLFMTQAICVP